MSAKAEPRLERGIGPLGSALLSFNGIVGAGIFALPATLHLQFGAFSPWLFPIFGLLILLIALPFANLAALFSSSGGPAAYTACFGRVASFEVGWIYYTARTTSFAANANVFAAYAVALWPALDGQGGRAAVIIAIVSLVTWINIVGVGRAMRALDVASLLKAAPLVALAAWVLIRSGGVSVAGTLPEFGAFQAAALITLYAFLGFENCVVPADETVTPRGTIPRALIATITGTTVLYFLIQLAYVSVMPAGATPEAPLAALAGIVIGPAGIVVLSLTAMASVGGNFLGSMTSTPRVTYALARDKLLPDWFAEVSARWRTPVNSILFMGIAGALLALSGSFVWLAVVSTLARLFIYGASILALPAARRANSLATGLALRTLIFGGLAVCIWAAAQSELRSWIMLAALLVAGTLLYAIAARSARRAAIPT